MKKSLLALTLAWALSASHIQALPSLNTITQKLVAAAPQMALWVTGYCALKKSAQKAALHGVVAALDFNDIKKRMANSLEIIRQHRIRTGKGRTDLSLENIQPSEITQVDVDALSEAERADVEMQLDRCAELVMDCDDNMYQCKKWTAALLGTMIATPVMSYVLHRYS